MKATIAIPTYNGIERIGELLDSCLRQEADFEFEVLVIDSGSTDGTLDAVRKRAAVRLHEIPKSSFGHGRTRNLAVEMARGDFVAFLTQDAVPADKHWLSEIRLTYRTGWPAHTGNRRPARTAVRPSSAT